MRRLLIGLIVLIVLLGLAGGGWLGFNLYVQHRATAEVEAVFEQIRSGGGKASRGKIGFELATRTLTIEDITVEPISLGQIKIAKVTAVGVRQADESRFSADGIEVAGVEAALTYNEPVKVKANYKIPQITVRDFSGSTRAVGAPASGDLLDMYRVILAQYETITASSIVAPTITVNTDAGAGNPGGGEFVYSGLTVQNINRGKIDTAKTDRLTYTLDVTRPGMPGKMTGELSGMTVHDFDGSAIAAALDSKGSSDDNFHRIYRRISATSYTVTMPQGVRTQIDGFIVDDIAIQPSKFRPAEIMALVPASGSPPPTLAQSRDMIGKLADFFEGFRIGKTEIGKLAIETPQGTARLNALSYDQSELALQGLVAPTVHGGQFKMERFALKSFRAASLLRWMAGSIDPVRTPSVDQAFGLFAVLDGAEIKGVVAPYKTSGKKFTIDTLSLDWGALVNSIPSKTNVVTRMVIPMDPKDPAHRQAIAAGIDELAIDLDIGAAWAESSKILTLAPVDLDIGGLGKAQLRVTLNNVPRGLFATDLMQLIGQAAQVEAGVIEFSLRDKGGVDSVTAWSARLQNVSRDAARRTVVDSVRVDGAKIAAGNPDVGTVVDAIASYVETPGQTLVIKLTPRAKAPLMQLMQLMQIDPQAVLAQFRIEASTGL